MDKKIWGALVVAGYMALAVAGAAPAPMPSLAAESASVDANKGDSGTENADDKARTPYFLTTPQLKEPLQPLAFLPSTATVRLHAAVATVPDPVETQLGRSFDSAVAAMLSAFQARGYSLSGFALAWDPREKDLERKAGETARHHGSEARGRWEHRQKPSVLVMRREHWREDTPQDVSSEYFLVFLVGEAPSFGVYPDAFRAAMTCALHFDRDGPVEMDSMEQDRPCDTAPYPARGGQLQIIGPTFSGSMQSIVAELRRLPTHPGTEILMISPSATAESNMHVSTRDVFGTVQNSATMRTASIPALHFVPLAPSLADQIEQLFRYVCRQAMDRPGNVEVFAEESTFGDATMNTARRHQEAAAEAYFKTKGNPNRWQRISDSMGIGRRDAGALIKGDGTDCIRDVALRRFPPNVASIRGAHSEISRAARSHASTDPARIAVTRQRSKLLELDMTSVELGSDRPPAYQPDLSARSDELMLSRLFDGIRAGSKAKIVIIVATDIRDGLFLLNEIRSEMPGALPVVIGMDFLMLHPDYRKASRGALVVGLGEPMVCLGTMNDPAAANTLGSCSYRALHRYLFPTDVAANVFRATVLFADRSRWKTPDSESFRQALRGARCPEARPGAEECPARILRVASLAGFFDTTVGYGSLVAANQRLAVQAPSYLAIGVLGLLMLVLAMWAWMGRNRAYILLPFMRQLVFRSAWVEILRELRAGAAQRARALRERVKAMILHTSHLAPDTVARRSFFSDPQLDRKGLCCGLVPRYGALLLLLMGGLAAVALGVAGFRFSQIAFAENWVAPGYFTLAHGMDIWAPFCILLLYACLCIMAILRLKIAGHRYALYWPELKPALRRDVPSIPYSEHAIWMTLIPVIITVHLLIYATIPQPVSVTSPWPWIVALLVLLTGIVFMAYLGRQIKRMGKLTLRLVQCAAGAGNALGQDGWPETSLIHAEPKTPFNLQLRYRDILALAVDPPQEWAYITLRLIDEPNCSGIIDNRFQDWQAQMIAELKLNVVALRSCAWCAMLAPVAVLLAMSAYPPVYERMLTSISIMLLLAAFAMTVYAVLKLETDPMLGPMYTREGNHLSFGGAVRALWPKFAAMGAVIVPLVAPDVWTWLNSLVRSINSFN